MQYFVLSPLPENWQPLPFRASAVSRQLFPHGLILAVPVLCNVFCVSTSCPKIVSFDDSTSGCQSRQLVPSPYPGALFRLQVEPIAWVDLVSLIPAIRIAHGVAAIFARRVRICLELLP